jgi:hypothetical protein
MKKSYSQAGVYQIIDTFTDAENQFLRAEEVFEKQFGRLSENIASQVSRDFFRLYSIR